MRIFTPAVVLFATLTMTQAVSAQADAPYWRSHRPVAMDDDQFDSTVLHAVHMASSNEEARTCRYYAHFGFVTTEQVSRVIRAVSSRNEAACALAFFPRVVDPMNWEEVYRPMSSSAERIVRESLDRMLGGVGPY